jgi:hypothetical protein
MLVTSYEMKISENGIHHCVHLPVLKHHPFPFKMFTCSNMAAYKMAAVKVTPPNDFSLGLIRSHNQDVSTGEIMRGSWREVTSSGIKTLRLLPRNA